MSKHESGPAAEFAQADIVMAQVSMPVRKRRSDFIFQLNTSTDAACLRRINAPEKMGSGMKKIGVRCLHLSMQRD
ncbi:MAG: hypothetical protein V4454_12715 [Pseudomonadota bacterium]